MSLYVLWRSRSLPNVLLFAPAIFIYAYIESLPSFFYYMISEPVLELKLLPAAYQWYFSIFLFWLFMGLVLNGRRFAKDFFPVLKFPFIYGIAVCSLGGLLSLTRFLDSFDLLLRVAVSVFILTAFSIYASNKIPYKNLKTFFVSALLDNAKKNRELRIFEIALSLQVVSVVMAYFNSYLNSNPAFFILTLLGITIINLGLLQKDLIKRKLLYSILVPLSLCLGYSINYASPLDILSRTWVLLAVLFIVSLILIHYSRK